MFKKLSRLKRNENICIKHYNRNPSLPIEDLAKSAKAEQDKWDFVIRFSLCYIFCFFLFASLFGVHLDSRLGPFMLLVLGATTVGWLCLKLLDVIINFFKL